MEMHVERLLGRCVLDTHGRNVGRIEEIQAEREGRDYVIDERGLLVFTREYLLRRGYCCKNGCRNCPYGFKKS